MVKRGPFCSFQLGSEQQLCAHIVNSHFQFDMSFTKAQGCSELEFVSGSSSQHWRLMLCASGLSPIQCQNILQTLKQCFLVKELYKTYATQLTFWPLRQDFIGNWNMASFHHFWSEASMSCGRKEQFLSRWTNRDKHQDKSSYTPDKVSMCYEPCDTSQERIPSLIPTWVITAFSPNPSGAHGQ